MSSLKSILKKYGIEPSRRLGQNFLIDRFAIKKIISAAELSHNDIVLEIGPGTGVLTRELVKRAKKVVAVEKDPRMIEILSERLGDFSNVEIVHEDILKLGLKSYTLKPYKVVANLPFYLTAPVIRKFLECNEARPRYMVLLIQKEVAQRIVARPPRMNLLAVSVQFYAEPKIIYYVSKKSFWPQPKVDSAIIKISNIKNQKPSHAKQGAAGDEAKPQRPSKIDPSLFFKVVKAGFSQPRKQIVNNLSKVLKLDKGKVKYWLLKNNITPEQRAETLTVEDWLNLAKTSNDKK